MNSWASRGIRESTEFQPKDLVSSVVSDWMVSGWFNSPTHEGEGFTHQPGDQRSAGGRTRVEVPAGCSLSGVDLPLGFCKRPRGWFKMGWARGEVTRYLTEGVDVYETL